MDNLFRYIWRLRPAAWMNDDSFERLTALFEYEPSASDEIAILVREPIDYGYFPADRLRATLEIYKRRAGYFKKNGKLVGINTWPTFGLGGGSKKPHDCPVAPPDFDYMVGYDGKVSNGGFCSLSPAYIEHIKERFTIFAETNPDFIWVDDDCRMTHLEGGPLELWREPTIYPCFCPRCVAGFDGGRWLNRETLVGALNKPGNQLLRKMWCDWGAERLERFCKILREAVDKVDPDIEMPFMSTGLTHSTFSGDYLRRCTKALRSRLLRPGHGFYFVRCLDVQNTSFLHS